MDAHEAARGANDLAVVSTVRLFHIRCFLVAAQWLALVFVRLVGVYPQPIVPNVFRMLPLYVVSRRWGDCRGRIQRARIFQVFATSKTSWVWKKGSQRSV